MRSKDDKPSPSNVARILGNSVICVPACRSSEVLGPTWRILSTYCLLLGNRGRWTQIHQVHLTFLAQCVVDIRLSVAEPCLLLQFSPPIVDRIVILYWLYSVSVRNMSWHLNTNNLQHFFVVLDAWIILYVSVSVFSIPTQNLMIVLTSTSPIDVIFLLICVSFLVTLSIVI